MISLRSTSIVAAGVLTACLLSAGPAMADGTASSGTDPSSPAGPGTPCGVGHIVSYSVHNDSETGGQIGLGPLAHQNGNDNPSDMLQPYHQALQGYCH